MCDGSSVTWLPDLVLFEKYNGDWEKYLNTLYNFFKDDFINSKPRYRGQRLMLKRYPLSKGKEATFWHFISTGSLEDDRLPDFRRCERIRWPKPMIENSEKVDDVKVWIEEISKEKRIHLLCPYERYLVVLAIRKGFIIPWTAFFIKYEHQVKKKMKRYEEYKKLTSPSSKTTS